MSATKLARWENKIRPLITKLPPKMAVSLYSKGRLDFLKQLEDEIPDETYMPPEHLARTLWGIRFRSPLMNAAGMFKNGECYEMVARQGAGAYLGGTGTWNKRLGNNAIGIPLPFAPYPRSGAASNWLGLPNDGDVVNANRAAVMCLNRRCDTPIGWSVTGSPNLQGEERPKSLVVGMKMYEQAGVDFLEYNESCKNAGHGNPQNDNLANRLRYVKERFLDERIRKLPVTVKFSCDTEVAQIPVLLDLLFELGYDGATFGNTSTAHEKIRSRIDPSERKLYDYFTQAFGGSVSGRPLKEISLELAARAAEYLRAGPPAHEFHVWRTGGIESWKDITASEQAGISMNGWYTGYWNAFAKVGHDVYKHEYEKAQAYDGEKFRQGYARRANEYVDLFLETTKKPLQG